MLTCSTAVTSPVDGRKPADGKALAGFLNNLLRVISRLQMPVDPVAPTRAGFRLSVY